MRIDIVLTDEICLPAVGEICPSLSLGTKLACYARETDGNLWKFLLISRGVAELISPSASEASFYKFRAKRVYFYKFIRNS